MLTPSAAGIWVDLVSHIRGNHSFLADTGADWALVTAYAHVYGPALVFHAGTSRAVRFVAADHPSVGGGKGRYARSCQLPAAPASWLVLGLLDNGHFVRCRPKGLKIETLRSRLGAGSMLPLTDTCYRLSTTPRSLHSTHPLLTTHYHLRSIEY